ncbi:hypothetical protein [Zunongwangia sp. H14]|uniref:hypothetical protein n=1 Tax=Zunongwangia sp. H14 TaxID=3240792 RepID=UPI0035658356
MTLQDLKEKVDNYKNSIEKVSQNREYWQNHTKPLLKDTLEKIKETYPLDWNVQVLDWTSNSEGVNITFGKKPSGIYEQTETSSRHYVKKGGTIVFSQAGNGDVFIIILYPSIEELVSEKEHKVLGKISPEKITEELIIENVGVFLDEMAKWENSNEQNSLGYFRKG